MKEKKRKKRSCYSLCSHDCKHISWCSAFTVFILWWAVLLNLHKHTHTHWSYFQLSLSSWWSPAKSVDAEVDWVTCEAHATVANFQVCQHTLSWDTDHAPTSSQRLAWADNQNSARYCALCMMCVTHCCGFSQPNFSRNNSLISTEWN